MNTVTRPNTETGPGAGATRGSAGPVRNPYADGATDLTRDGWAWPEHNLEPSTRAGRVVGTVVPALFLVYLIEPIRQVFGTPHPAAIRVVVPVVVVTYAVVYMYAMQSERKTSHVVRLVTFGIMTGCGLTLAAILGPDDLVYMTYAISMALVQLPPLVGLMLRGRRDHRPADRDDHRRRMRRARIGVGARSC